MPTSKGKDPSDASPLTQFVGDHAHEISVEVEVRNSAKGGLFLFFDDRLFLAMGIVGHRMITYCGGRAAYWQEPTPATTASELRIVKVHQIVTFYYRPLGGELMRHGVRSKVTGYNATTIDDLLS